MCEYASDKLFNVKRHISRRHDASINTNINNNSSAAENVVVSPQNVVNLPQNVVNLPQNVVNFPQNVVNDSDLVVHDHMCRKCKRVFTRSDNLKRHEKACKCLNEKHECDICHEVFKDRHAKYYHRKHCPGPVQQPRTMPQSQEITNNITNNQCSTTNIGTQNNTQNNVNYVLFNVQTSDPIEFKTDHMDNAEVLKAIFNRPEFEDVFIKFSQMMFSAIENRIVQKQNLSRDVSKVFMADENKWMHTLDSQVYYRLARGVSTSALTLTDKHKKVKVKNDHRECLQNIQMECEISPNTASNDECTKYSKPTRDGIKAIKLLVHDYTDKNG